MKTLLISLTFLLSFLVSFGQQKRTGFDDFHSFVQEKYNVPASVRNNCDWQYAIVKLTVDDNNRVTNYTTLNEVSKDFFNSLAHLKGYQFNRNIPIHKRPVVFYLTIENDEHPCDVPPKHITSAMATSSVFAYLHAQQEKQPNTLFIFNPIVILLLEPVK
ncbi:hypothetical protein [Mucilaginibacter paludis]|uniref:TonB C-terminal domain-containing protein n=1 Tax=Mucilaginibacter paludis DSM 18603 TaxID=714943 RepID=H1YHY3_9SPHI|nr:hypothetical protein [Mucilaginibacter paludis]EHQ25531.1 hypothetical protein Mucpa_1370 [Mucilaginibacter paludis DSM 18603]